MRKKESGTERGGGGELGKVHASSSIFCDEKGPGPGGIAAIVDIPLT